MAALPRVRQRVEVALRKLGRLYPKAAFPPVTIAVGRGKPMGTTSADTGVLIGIEMLCAVKWDNLDAEERFVRVIVHEYIHIQRPRLSMMTSIPLCSRGRSWRVARNLAPS
jgi:hypothetical protein